MPEDRGRRGQWPADPGGGGWRPIDQGGGGPSPAERVGEGRWLDDWDRKGPPLIDPSMGRPPLLDPSEEVPLSSHTPAPVVALACNRRQSPRPPNYAGWHRLLLLGGRERERGRGRETERDEKMKAMGEVKWKKFKCWERKERGGEKISM